MSSFLFSGVEPNPPSWPTTVTVFSPSDSSASILSSVNAAYATNGGSPDQFCNHGEFSTSRYAFLFHSGEYDVDVPVGYYTSVAGLGRSPLDTVFTSGRGVFAEEGCGDFSSGSLTTFWRSAENFRSASDFNWSGVGNGMTWAVSQASPLRHVAVDHDLLLFEYLPSSCCAAGFASGGYGSGLSVQGATKFGSQQQFYVRSSDVGNGGDVPVWNGVFAGVLGSPVAQCGANNEDGTSAKPSVSVADSVPFVADKPYISSLDGEHFELVVPKAVKEQVGIPWDASGPIAGAAVYDFSNVYVASAADSAATINAKLSSGLHVVLSPGIYDLEAAISITFENQVLLGLGLATLVAPLNGEPCIKIADVSGVRVAAVLLEASATSTASLLEVGTLGSGFSAKGDNPIVLSDIFARVGGPKNGVGPVDSMLVINAGNTVLDNSWLWRADHSAEGLVYDGENPAQHGLVVNGDNVFAYGLAAEHTLSDNVVWSGTNGVIAFYQAEIMYDYVTDGFWDHSCLSVGKNATLTATGLGCYSFFRDAEVRAPSSFRIEGDAIIDKAVSVFLNGVNGSGIDSVIAGDNKAVNENQRVSYHCDAGL